MRARVSLAALALVWSAHGLAVAPDYVLSEKPAPGSVDDAESSIEDAYRKKFRLPSLIPLIRDRIQSLPPFIRDGGFSIKLRNYYFNRTRQDDNNSEAWAQGGGAEFQTGWWQERVKLGAVLYTSQRLYGPARKDGTRLLKPVQQSFTVLGQAYMQIRPREETHIVLYRQPMDLPYLNRNDNRMVPNTFEAYSFQDHSIRGLTYGFGYVRQMKKKDSDKFVSMTEAAGIDGVNHGQFVGGIYYEFRDKADIGLINQYTEDFMNNLYAEANYGWTAGRNTDFTLGLQYTDQRSVGDDLDSNFNTHAYGAKVSASNFGVVVSAAFTSVSGNRQIRSPFGGYPGYASSMIKDFDRAGEDAVSFGVSTDFRAFGIKGLGAYVVYTRGDTPDSGANATPDQEEYDVTLDYRVQSGLFKDLWVRLRHAYVDQDGNGATDLKDNRIIVNYDLRLW